MDREKLIKIIITSVILILFLLAYSRFFVTYDKDTYCKFKFGEEYSNVLSAFSCSYTNYTTGIKEMRYYTKEQLYEICSLPKYFHFNKWKGECRIPEGERT